MYIPKQLAKISDRINAGHRVNRIKVRDLLHMFGAERRGLNKAQEIRSALDALGLRTDPDFQAAWIDSPVRIVPLQPIAPTLDPDEEDEEVTEDSALPAQEITEGANVTTAPANFAHELPSPLGPLGVSEPEDYSSTGVVQTLTSTSSDPTFRIGNLAAANAGVTSVNIEDTVTKALTVMLQQDFSQLPIMPNERDVKGAISWKSIASRQMLGCKCDRVADCRDDAQVIDANGTLFDALPTIAAHGYVLVRDAHRKITGIVTASDLTLNFQQLTQPFLLLREIELHIRAILNGKITSDDLQILSAAPAMLRPASQIGDLSFGHYIQLFQRAETWKKLNIRVDQKSLVSQLDIVRQIRNDVMHFDPDPMTSRQLEVLKDAAKFMQELYRLCVVGRG